MTQILGTLLVYFSRTSTYQHPPVGCLLMVFKYLKAFKKHPLEGLGMSFLLPGETSARAAEVAEGRKWVTRVGRLRKKSHCCGFAVVCW